MRNPSLPYILPFALLLGFIALESLAPLPPLFEYPARAVILALVLWAFARRQISFRVASFTGSLLIGAAVFLIWIAPDVLVEGYREHWLFRNSLTGSAPAPASGYESLPWIALLFRVVRAVILVPVIEELFWRAWLMRWIIHHDFQSVPLGTYTPRSFWITAVLFAAEHGAYWDVGLVAGVVYNWWMVWVKSLGDCILAHAITNGLLSAYVLLNGHWHYW